MLAAGLAILSSANALGQDQTPALKTSEILAELRSKHSGQVNASERREAYQMLMQGQRHSWEVDRARTQAAQITSISKARESFLAAAAADPTISEVYVALAELETSRRLSNENIEEGVTIAEMALAVSPNSFGAHRLLARLHSMQSRIGQNTVGEESAKKAVEHWETVVKMDPANAEGWAFLSLFYERSGKTDRQIEALEKWVAAPPPSDSQFFSLVMGPRFPLTSENATMRLGSAYLSAGRSQEAVVVLSSVVADQPQNTEAISKLEEAVFSSSEIKTAEAIESLQQAVFANPGSNALVSLLAEIYHRNGDNQESINTFRNAVIKLAESDVTAAAYMQLALGDFLGRHRRTDEALNAYRTSLSIFGVIDNKFGEKEAAFVKTVLEKKVQTLKVAGRLGDAAELLNKYRPSFSPADQFIDRQLILVYRESGERVKALEVVENLRQFSPNDVGLQRLQATLLAETGNVAKAVELIKGTDYPNRDEFSDLLFISELYNRSSDSKMAAQAAEEALKMARSRERQQIAKLTIATAHYYSGDFESAEKVIREVLAETPGNPIALNNLGYFLVERNERLEEARDMIRRAVNVDPTNPSYLDSLGWAYFKLGNYAEAEKYLKEAVRFDSGSATIHEHLGDVYQKQGKNELAKASWERALNLAENEKDIQRLRTKLGLK